MTRVEHPAFFVRLVQSLLWRPTDWSFLAFPASLQFLRKNLGELSIRSKICLARPATTHQTSRQFALALYAFLCSLMSSLRSLPPDGIRPILNYLDLVSLSRLFATFDRNIIRQLSAPDAISFLQIAKQKTLPSGPMRYFLSSVTNVGHLWFDKGVKITAEQLLLLKTINPRRLKLHSDFLDPQIKLLLVEAEMNPDNETLAMLSENLLPNCFPDLALLTPRLETLSFDYNDLIIPVVSGRGRFSYKNGLRILYDKRFDFELPPTVTKLEVCNPPDPFPFPSSLFEGSPKTLRSLKLETTDSVSNEYRGAAPLNLILSRFECLEELELIGVWMLEIDETSRLPATLQSLTFVGPFFPLDLITSLDFKSSKLLHLSLTSKNQLDQGGTSTPLSLSELLPPSLRSLELHFGGFLHDSLSICDISDLPLTLHSLALTINTLAPSFMSNLLSMRNLARLQLNVATEFPTGRRGPVPTYTELTSSWARVMPPYIEFLESNFLELDSSALIRHLPSTLKTLSVSAFESSLRSLLLEQAPSCKIHVKQSSAPK